MLMMAIYARCDKHERPISYIVADIYLDWWHDLGLPACPLCRVEYLRERPDVMDQLQRLGKDAPIVVSPVEGEDYRTIADMEPMDVSSDQSFSSGGWTFPEYEEEWDGSGVAPTICIGDYRAKFLDKLRFWWADWRERVRMIWAILRGRWDDVY
jgi:hypothetical protein